MTSQKRSIGIFGFGAFGQFMASHLIKHFDVSAYDTAENVSADAAQMGVRMAPIADVAKADIVVLAVPIPRMEETIDAIVPHLQPGALVIDVGSVKVKPAKWMSEKLPSHVDMVCTHPLFGPQSGRDGIKGQKIVVCPSRSQARMERLVAFLRDVLELEVIIATPDEHDKEVAKVQGLTHIIGRILSEMEPLPRVMTTKSYNYLMESVEIVRYNSTELFLSIEHENPYSRDVRETFFKKFEELKKFIETHDAKMVGKE